MLKWTLRRNKTKMATVATKHHISGTWLFYLAVERLYFNWEVTAKTLEKALRDELHSNGTHRFQEYHEFWWQCAVDGEVDVRKTLERVKFLFPEADYTEAEKFVQDFEGERNAKTI